MSASPWLFSRRLDLAVFGGSFALAMAALALGAGLGVLDSETPGWAWIPCVLLCDVAHVWATAFVSYLDPAQRQARARLLTVVPALGLAASVALYSLGELWFWRALAYLAIFHFVRQQVGWVRLYRARVRDEQRLGALIDDAATYATTLFPLLYWHTHPRAFSWFVANDVVQIQALTAAVPVAAVLYALSLAAYAWRSLLAHRRGLGSPGRDLLIVTTAITWFVGIVVLDSDYAFTVTNVFTHGVPYLALIWAQRSASARPDAASKTPAGPSWSRGVLSLLAFVWLLAFLEESLWDRAVWRERSWLFGEGWELDDLHGLLVPLLALPQLTHYLLDGFLWRRRRNPRLVALVDS